MMFFNDGIETIPLNNMKRPLLSFADVPITKEFIEASHYDYAPAPMLGVLCRGLWCIDIDVADDGTETGFESLKAIPEYNEFLTNASKTWAQKTPSGGMHYIFKKLDGIEYGQKINYLPSVDIKAHVNNFFVLGGSISNKGRYVMNGKEPIYYEGELENKIFSTRGNYEQQKLQQYSVSNVLTDYDFSHLKNTPNGQGLGRQAYERIVNGTSTARNDDLYKAFSYAKTCNVDIEPLKVIIGTRKDGDVFTQREFDATLESAFK